MPIHIPSSLVSLTRLAYRRVPSHAPIIDAPAAVVRLPYRLELLSGAGATRRLSASARGCVAGGGGDRPSTSLPPTAERIRQRLRERIADVKDNIATVPNALCIARIGTTPLIGYLVVNEHFLSACILFSVAGATDLLDGWIARRYPSQRSMLGSILDPVADKFLISTLFVTLTYVNFIPLALTAIILLRDVLLIIGGFIRRYQILEPPFTLRRFFNPSISSVRVMPTFASKVNTVVQLGLVTLSLASPVFGFEHHPLLNLLCICTGVTTIYSGLQYATKNAIIPIKKVSHSVKVKSP